MNKLRISLEDLEKIKKIPNKSYDLITAVISKTAIKLLTEAYRILQFGGIIEIWSPDPECNKWAFFALAEAKFQAMSKIEYSLDNENNIKDLFGIGALKLDLNNFQFINYKELIEDTNQWCADLPKDFKYVVGIPRSGMLVATIIADWLNIPLCTIAVSGELVILKGGAKCKQDELIEKAKMLVVDDSSNWGKTIIKAKKLLKNYSNVYYGTLYCSSQSRQFLDYGFKEVKQPRVFEWNLFHHPILAVSCVDIDGVLSEDPTSEQNDDGPKYLKFLQEVKPKYMPTRKIHTLVTCRLEKYRKVTVDWLKKHNIKYNNLIMMNYPTREARMRANKYAEYKADAYKKASETVLFIESEGWQAVNIARETGKRTLHIRTMLQYGGLGLFK